MLKEQKDNIKMKINCMNEIILFKFQAEDCKKADITRFINLFKKLKVKVERLEMPKNIRGQKYNLVVIDEAKQF